MQCNNYPQGRGSPCDPGQANSVFYFVTSIVALLILISVVVFCVCCVCLRRRRIWSALQRSVSFPGPLPQPVNPTINPVSYRVPSQPPRSYQSDMMEEGRLNANHYQQPSEPRKNPGVGVIMPGEAEVTFIAEPSSPVKASANEKSKSGSSRDEDSYPVHHPPKSL